MTILAIDIGGSGSRAVLRSGVVDVWAAEGPELVVGSDGIQIDSILDRLVSEDALAVQPLPEVVSVGMSGLIGLASGPDIVAVLQRRWPESDVILASDAVTALTGAFGIDGGVGVAVGTGVVGLGTDLLDIWRRVDGWGHLLGDEGGGAWIGERGLRAALKAHDGRCGGSAALLAALRDEFGEPESLPRSIYSTGKAASLLASFATAVARTAEDGDAAAADIWHEAGIALAQTALAGFAPGVPPRVAVVGGLTKAGELLRHSLLAELFEHRPDASLVFGETSPLQGSLALARIALETPRRLASHPPYLTYAPRRRRR